MTKTKPDQETSTEPVEALREDPKNARKMPRANLRGLKFSLHEYGDLGGLCWNEKLGALVCGHQRMRALREAGAKTWTRLSKTEGFIVHPKSGERFAIRIVEWDEAKHRAAQIVANNPELQGSYSDDVLPQLKEMEDSILFEAMRLDELMVEFEDDPEEESAPPVSAPEERFAIVIECESEEEQTKLLERFLAEKLNCRAVVEGVELPEQ